MRRGILVGGLAAVLTLLALTEAAQAQYGRGRRGGTTVVVDTPYFSGVYGRGYRGGYGGGWGSPYSSYYGSPYGYGYGPSYGYYRPYSGISVNVGRSPYFYGSPGLYGGPVYGSPVYGAPVVSAPVVVQGSSDPHLVLPRSGGGLGGGGAAPEARNNQARVRVIVPAADAQVWFEGALTRQRGTERFFTSPELESGKTFTYTVKASWMENGREVTREKRVEVQAGQETTISFMEPAGARPETIRPRDRGESGSGDLPP